MNRQQQLLLFSITILAISFSGCKKERFENLKMKKTDLEMVRFENKLFHLNLYEFDSAVNGLREQYPEFLSLFGNKIIEIGDPSKPWFNQGLQSFITDQAIYNIYNSVSQAHKDLTTQTAELNKAFGRWNTVFPDKPTPKIYTYVSGFNQTIVTADSMLGISLEKFLGPKEELYRQVYPPIPAYQSYNMNPSRIPVDVIRAWATTETEYKPEQDNLISQMIYQGQIMYLTSKLLNETHDTLLFGFTPAQLDFCKNRETEMWTYLIEQKLLFSTDKFRINQFIGEAPYTKDFQKESPGKAAVWIGYKIVEQFAEKRKDLSLSEIVTYTNYQGLLNESRYRPN